MPTDTHTADERGRSSLPQTTRIQDAPAPLIRNTRSLMAQVSSTAEAMHTAVVAVEAFESSIRDGDARAIFGVALSNQINRLTIAAARLRQA